MRNCFIGLTVLCLAVVAFLVTIWPNGWDFLGAERPRAPRRCLTVADEAQGQGWSLAADQAHARTIAFSPCGGQLVVSGMDGIVRILDSANGIVLLSHDQRLSPANYASGAVFSPDGKAIASGSGEKTVELWDAANGMTINRLDMPEQKGIGVNPILGAFSPDGGLLAVEAGHKVLLFDFVMGKLLRSFAFNAGEGPDCPPKMGAVLALTRTEVATANCSKDIVLWDLKTGEKVRKLESERGTVASLSVSHDGRTLASCTGTWSPKGADWGDIESEELVIRLWDVPTGRRLLTIKGHTDNVRSVVFSPDGRSLVSGSEDKTIRLWETATGKQLLLWKVDDQVNQVAISPDGKKVAAALVGGAVALFPIDPLQLDMLRPTVDEKAFDHLWTDLAGQDAEQAYRAVRSLSESGEDVSARIGKRLKPLGSIVRWIADLDNDDFDRREAASKQLAAFGAQAEPALRKALAETQSAEVRSRINQLLKTLGEWVVTDPDALRSLRAIWVLERIGTPAARTVFEDLAKGAPEVRQTQEAKAALDWLDKRAAAKP